MIDRRRFLGSAALLLEQAIPFGRVWSFPTKIVIPRPNHVWLTYQELIYYQLYGKRSEGLSPELRADEMERRTR
jgi:hypothetical protein